jgi:hypothetical protein
MMILVKLSKGDIVASRGSRALRKLNIVGEVEINSNFTLSDGSILLTADGLVFNTKEE